eukprot:comp22662_c0_seq1/m.34969 comp22662_c0_seq1/g.34969  ORF comp22662_c0_seq1/g.34969 comp22662_c0_seq1/m.34969 type:complete len:345 (-) comp22662_c0_seq1:129-1163(-)
MAGDWTLATAPEFLERKGDGQADRLAGVQQLLGPYSALRVVADREGGCYVLAACNLRAGDLVLRVEPMAQTVDRDYVKSACDYCLKYILQGSLPLNCTGCEFVRWCSAECRQQSQQTHTGTECMLFKRFKGAQMDAIDKERARQIIRILLAPEDQRRAVGLLCTNRDRASALTMRALGEVVGSMRRLIERRRLPSEHRLVDLLLATNSNQFGIVDTRGEAYAGALYLPAAFFNHSCRPSMARVQEGRCLALYAARDLKEGDLLTVSYRPVYTGPDLDLRAVRRQELQDEYHFKCMCPACSALDMVPPGPNPAGVQVCVECERVVVEGDPSKGCICRNANCLDGA